MYRSLAVLLVVLLAPIAYGCGGGEEESAGPGTITPASIGSAVVVSNPEEFTEKYLGGESISDRLCLYYGELSLVDCGSDGAYRLSDGPVAADARCKLILDGSEPVAISCRGEEDEQPILYATQED